MKREEREQMLKDKLLQMKTYENALYKKGIQYVAGVDEAGRGPLAGPVVAAAVVLPVDFDIIGVDDSKKLTEKKREELFAIIQDKAVAYGIGIIDNAVIDKINILQATKEAMKEALRNLERKLREMHGADWRKALNRSGRDDCCIQHILIDALTLKDVPIPQTAIIKGDSKSVSIAAASILAKVTRDRMMAEYNKVYPGYAFDKNKGYGTKAHCEGIRTRGICTIHRRSFLKNILGSLDCDEDTDCCDINVGAE